MLRTQQAPKSLIYNELDFWRFLFFREFLAVWRVSPEDDLRAPSRWRVAKVWARRENARCGSTGGPDAAFSGSLGWSVGPG